MDKPKNNVTCWVYGDSFTKKNGKMLSHLGYIHSNGERDTNIKFYKNMKSNVVHAFQGCDNVAPTYLSLQICNIFKVVHKVRN